MPETCENWLSVNCYVHYVCQTCKIYQVLPFSVDFKAPGELWNPLSKTVQSKQNMWNNHKTEKNLYVEPVNIFPNFLHCVSHRSTKNG